MEQQEELLKSQQFSVYQQKSNFQPKQSIIKFQSTMIDSDSDNNNDNDNDNEKEIEQKEQQQQVQIQKEIHPQTNNITQIKQSTYKSEIINSDSEEEIQEVQQSHQEENELKQQQNNQNSINNSEQYIENKKTSENPEIENNYVDEQIQKIEEYDVEEIIKQSQIILQSQKQKEKKAEISVVNIIQADSEEDSKDEDSEEDNDVVNIQEQTKNESQEINSDNRIMMSIMASSKTKSIKKQQKEIEQLTDSSKNQENVFKSQIIFDKESLKPIVIRENNFYENNQRLQNIIKIQRKYRNKKTIQKYKKDYQLIKKNNRYRIHVIQELITTETQYVNDIELIINKIQKPLIEKMVQLELTINLIFNLDSIYNFNKEFLNALKKTENQLISFPYCKIMKNVIPLLNGFIFYYEYCKNYDNAQKQFTIQMTKNNVFKDFVFDIQKKNILKGLDIQSYLIKPVQRLPKYILLYKDLLKHTDQYHPDYEAIQQCLQTFEKINNQNNNEMKNYLEQAKMIELQQQFGQSITITEPNRQFILEEIISFYSDKQENNIILYLFSNLLLLAKKLENDTVKYRCHQQLTHLSYIKEKEDTNYFSNLVEIITKSDTIILICTDLDQKQLIIKKIQEQISNLKQIVQRQSQLVQRQFSNSIQPFSSEQSQLLEQTQNNYTIKVNVIGTENRNLHLKPYTIYSLNIQIQNYSSKIFVRYSQMVEIQQLVNKNDPRLKVPIFSTMNWFHSIDSKVIDERKLLIEKFLQITLSSDKCVNDKAYQQQILAALSLPLNFYDISNNQQHSHVDQDEVMKTVLQSQFGNNIQPNELQSMIMKRQTSNILIAAQAQTRRTSILNFDQEKLIVIGKDANKSPYNIYVTLMDSQIIQIGFEKITLTLFIKNVIAKYIGLNQWLDFRLFIVDKNGDQRVIDDQETMSSILDAHQNINKGFANKFKKLFVSEQKYQFIFRKYYYLKSSQEEADYKIDEKRLRYIIYDTIWETKMEKYDLQFSDYCLVAALFFFSTKTKSTDIPDILLLQKVVPKKYLNNIKERLWFEQITKNVNLLQSQLIKLQSDNISKSKQQNKKLVTSVNGLAQLMIMNVYKSNPLFGMTLYFVECSKQVIQILKQSLNCQVSSNIYIGINIQGFHILRASSSSKDILYSIDHEYVTETKAFTTEFSCKVNQIKLSFTTQFPFEIKQLLSEYLALKNFTNQLANGIN